MVSDLRIIDCHGCGACCFEQCSPPGYLLLLRDTANLADWPEPEDIPRVASMPEEAHQAIRDYLLRDDFGDDMPCCWLDQKTNRCRWYEWRPQICRDFPVGSESCVIWRSVRCLKADGEELVVGWTEDNPESMRRAALAVPWVEKAWIVDRQRTTDDE